MAQSKEQLFQSQIDQAVPDQKAIVSNPNFQAFLHERVNSPTGVTTRIELLLQAERSGNADFAIAEMNVFRNRYMQPQQAAPQVSYTSTPDPVQNTPDQTQGTDTTPPSAQSSSPQDNPNGDLPWFVGKKTRINPYTMQREVVEEPPPEQNLAQAQYNLALMYDTGSGVPKNDTLAAQWYQKAASLGYAAAQYNLGLMYAAGRGVPKDDALAVQWWQKAAERGYIPTPPIAPSSEGVWGKLKRSLAVWSSGE